MKWADARRAGEGRSRGFLGEPKGGRAAARVACTAGRGESRYPRQERESPLFHRPPSYPPPRRGEGTLLRVRLRAFIHRPPLLSSPTKGGGNAVTRAAPRFIHRPPTLSLPT